MAEDISNSPDDKLWGFVYGRDGTIAGQAMAAAAPAVEGTLYLAAAVRASPAGHSGADT